MMKVTSTVDHVMFAAMESCSFVFLNALPVVNSENYVTSLRGKFASRSTVFYAVLW